MLSRHRNATPGLSYAGSRRAFHTPPWRILILNLKRKIASYHLPRSCRITSVIDKIAGPDTLCDRSSDRGAKVARRKTCTHRRGANRRGSVDGMQARVCTCPSYCWHCLHAGAGGGLGGCVCAQDVRSLRTRVSVGQVRGAGLHASVPGTAAASGSCVPCRQLSRIAVLSSLNQRCLSMPSLTRWSCAA